MINIESAGSLTEAIIKLEDGAKKVKWFIFSGIMYGSFSLCVVIVVIQLEGMAAYFAKTFYHVQPAWLFGLFD